MTWCTLATLQTIYWQIMASGHPAQINVDMTLFLPKCWLHNKLEVTFGVSLGLKRAPRHKTTGTWHQLGNIDCAQNGRKRKFEDVQKAIYVMHRKVVCASPKDHQSVFKLKEKYFFDTFQTLTQKNINQECFYPPPLFAPFPARIVCISGRVLRQSLFRHPYLFGLTVISPD